MFIFVYTCRLVEVSKLYCNYIVNSKSCGRCACGLDSCYRQYKKQQTNTLSELDSILLPFFFEVEDIDFEYMEGQG